MADLLIFAVAPDQAVRNIAQIAVSQEGHRLQTFQTNAHLLSALDEAVIPHLVLLETESNSEELYSKLLRHVPETSLCFLMKPGECHVSPIAETFTKAKFLTKPILKRDIEALLEETAHSLEVEEIFGISRMPVETTEHSAAGHSNRSPAALVVDDLGENRYFLALSPAMLEIYREVKLLEKMEVPVLILGESGTGKEVVAHLLHKHSHRAAGNFVNVNCAALPTGLLESELFGHAKGAFTSAFSDRPGRFEQSNGGTILLDEIGEISGSMQSKLLHVLQDGQFTRLGARQTTKVDVHVLAATNISMERALADKTFREDLYYRLNTFMFNVPPLRERSQEIPFLVSEMIWRTPPTMKPSGFTQFSTELMNLMTAYKWPGNVRELRNFATRTMIMQDESTAIHDLESKLDRSAPPKTQLVNVHSIPQTRPMRSLIREIRHHTESLMVEEALIASGWNRRIAARKLDISYRSLLYKIQQYHLVPRRRQSSG